MWWKLNQYRTGTLINKPRPFKCKNICIPKFLKFMQCSALEAGIVVVPGTSNEQQFSDIISLCTDTNARWVNNQDPDPG
jgi:hypothetical protein